MDSALFETDDKLIELFRFYIDTEAKIAEQLPLHLVDFAKAEETLADDCPTLVGVGVIAGALAGEHESRDEETVT